MSDNTVAEAKRMQADVSRCFYKVYSHCCVWLAVPLQASAEAGHGAG